MAESAGLEVAPLRSLDDFLLESARFQVPNFKDLEKWGNRVVNNLIYYQTNYFLMALALFALVGFFHPVRMVLGVLAIGIACGLFTLASNAGPKASEFRKQHPLASVGAVLVGAYFVVYLVGAILVFMLGILLPVSAIFVHASLRLRNIRNKLANKMEKIGLKKDTPMGVILESIGISTEPFL